MRIVLAVSGSIAAYKACDLTSKCVQAGHEVNVVMTREACRFVQPLSFTALTHRPVFTDASLWAADSGAGGVAAHLRASEDADVLIVAPCTANLIGKFAHGIADEVVTTTYLGATCPILIAPAMNHRMWANARVKANVETLRNDGVTFVGPEQGWQAEGESGMGRMSEPDAIRAAAERLLQGGGSAG